MMRDGCGFVAECKCKVCLPPALMLSMKQLFDEKSKERGDWQGAKYACPLNQWKPRASKRERERIEMI